MATTETAKNIFDSTSKKLYFMLKSVFDSEDTIQNTMAQIYNEVFTACESPSETDIYIRTAIICFGALGTPDGTNTTNYPIENMHAFFKSCENFDKPISNESVAVIDVLNGQLNVLAPISRLIVLLRMYTGMTPAEIASLAGTDENSITINLFNAYRTIMPAAVQACSNTPSLQGQPMLQLIRISLLRQAFNTTVPADIAEKAFAAPAADTVQNAESAIIEETVNVEESAPVMRIYLQAPTLHLRLTAPYGHISKTNSALMLRMIQTKISPKHINL